jgi:hypothetical protein
MLASCVGDPEPRADRQLGELIDPHRGPRAGPPAPPRRGARAWAGAFAACRPDHRGLATFDPLRVKRRLDDGGGREARRDQVRNT